MRTLFSPDPYFIHKDAIRKMFKDRIEIELTADYWMKDDLEQMFKETGIENNGIEVKESPLGARYLVTTVTLESLTDLFSLSINMECPIIIGECNDTFDLQMCMTMRG